mgnify:CR=1 FL=1|jgi:hypothetical protein|tara:strand:- start:546 stop:782 length:237 start_codon:yes stop_codon:yes gene_type:complete
MITVNLTKAKTIAHDVRRAKRAEEFAPLDEVIMKQIPDADADAAEVSRAAVRTKYATVQTNIDAAADVAALKTVVESI